MAATYESPEEYIAARLATMDPTYRSMYQGGSSQVCVLCGGSDYVPGSGHDESCIWLLAREFYPHD